MNYLAHFLLSSRDAETLVGSMLGDFCRDVDLALLPSGVRGAVELHFRVDAFTDAHPVVRESKRRIEPPHRRYAGVLIDMFYDHFLARNWEQYSTESFPEFTARAYAALRAHEGMLPERMRRAAGAMVADDWLGSYREVAGIEAALGRMARRLTRQNNLATGADALRCRYEELEEDFHRFFPDLQRFAAREVQQPRGWGITG